MQLGEYANYVHRKKKPCHNNDDFTNSEYNLSAKTPSKHYGVNTVMINCVFKKHEKCLVGKYIYNAKVRRFKTFL